MSAKLVGAVLENPEWFESRGEMLVMILLADSASVENGFSCWYGVETLAYRSKMTRRGVQKILRSLEERELIETNERRGRKRTNVYRVRLDEKREVSSPRSEFTANGSSHDPLLVFTDIQEEGREEGGSKKREETTVGSKTTREEGYSFEEFWEEYGNRKDKAAARRAWNRLTKKEKEKIRDHVPRYVSVTATRKGEGKTIRKYPASYLNAKSWEDEDLPEVWVEKKSLEERLMSHAEAIAYRERVLGTTGDGNPNAKRWEEMFETVKNEEGTFFRVRKVSLRRVAS